MRGLTPPVNLQLLSKRMPARKFSTSFQLFLQEPNFRIALAAVVIKPNFFMNHVASIYSKKHVAEHERMVL